MAPAQVFGDVITLSKFAQWPQACVKCGTQAGLVPRVQKYAWFPQWTYALLFLGLIPAAIIQAILTKRAQITHAVCAPCGSKWTMARVMYVLSLLGPVFGGIAIMMLGVAANTGAVVAIGGLLLFPGILIFPTIVHFAMVRPNTLRATFMDDHTISLAGVSPAVLQMMSGR
jgi:hypothetical protein